jgi:hypothetical protein
MGSLFKNTGMNVKQENQIWEDSDIVLQVKYTIRSARESNPEIEVIPIPKKWIEEWDRSVPTFWKFKNGYTFYNGIQLIEGGIK